MRYLSLCLGGPLLAPKWVKVACCGTPARTRAHWEPRTWKTLSKSHLIAGQVMPRRPNSLHFSRPGLKSGTASSTQTPNLGSVVGGRGDALAEMPSDKPRAQLAFKNSMIRGILQFTLRIAFRCVLHRCKSQDIRC
jgi:hypothetical protein